MIQSKMIEASKEGKAELRVTRGQEDWNSD